jgi:hypothetical protein
LKDARKTVCGAVQNSCKIKIVLCHIMREINKMMMVLKKDAPGLCSDTCLSPSPDRNGGIEIKSEAVLAVEQQRGPVPISFPGIKAEHEVSCIFVFRLLGTFQCP